MAPGLIDAALAGFDYRQATSALWRIVDEANRYVNVARPWDLARAERGGGHARASTWTVSWPPSSGPASSSPGSWRRSCPAPRP